jgi:hypothetical protein
MHISCAVNLHTIKSDGPLMLESKKEFTEYRSNNFPCFLVFFSGTPWISTYTIVFVAYFSGVPNALRETGLCFATSFHPDT